MTKKKRKPSPAKSKEPRILVKLQWLPPWAALGISFLVGVFSICIPVYIYQKSASIDFARRSVEADKILVEALELMGGKTDTISLRSVLEKDPKKLKLTKVRNLIKDQALPLAKSSKAYRYLGICCFALNDLDEAKEAFEDALSIDPEDDEAMQDLAVIAAVNKNYKEAAELFEKALEINPKLVIARHGLGNALYLKGDAEGAEKAFRRAIREDPIFIDAYADLADLLIDKDDKDALNEAADICREALEIDNTDCRFYRKLFPILRMLGRDEELRSYEALSRDRCSEGNGDI